MLFYMCKMLPVHSGFGPHQNFKMNATLVLSKLR